MLGAIVVLYGQWKQCAYPTERVYAKFYVVRSKYNPRLMIFIGVDSKLIISALFHVDKSCHVMLVRPYPY